MSDGKSSTKTHIFEWKFELYRPDNDKYANRAERYLV